MCRAIYIPPCSGLLLSAEGGANASIGAATAVVAGEFMVNLLRRGLGVFIEQSLGGNHESGRAETALLGVILDERLLNGVKGVAGTGETLDGFNLAILCVYGEHGAGVDGLAVEKHGAGTTFGTIADALGASKFELIAKSVEESDAGFELSLEKFAVYVKGDGHGTGTVYGNFLAGDVDDGGTDDHRNRDRDAGDFQEVATGNPGRVWLFGKRRSLLIMLLHLASTAVATDRKSGS